VDFFLHQPPAAKGDYARNACIEICCESKGLKQTTPEALGYNFITPGYFGVTQLQFANLIPFT